MSNNPYTDYTPPTENMAHFLTEVLDVPGSHAEADADTIAAILEAGGKLASETLAPLNRTGDLEGSTLENGEVTTPEGFKEAYIQFTQGGWNGLSFDEEYGGQNLPKSLSFAVQEMVQAANMSFGLCPLLNQGAVEALTAHGSEELKNLYLRKLIAGEWTGTMNLTEPQAGSDLGAIKTMATPNDDGTFSVVGSKIFITYGEHDFTNNIVHLVLARTPDAPKTTEGLSLFLVPKFIPDENGNPGARNDLICSSIEHKLGIKASPTCVMNFGDNGGATGWLVGNLHDGMKNMFTMMNNARLSVGLQGVAIADRAYQAAALYANDRKQGGKAIINYPDVQRMLHSMDAQIQAGRAMTYTAASYLDKGPEGKARVDLLTPLVKAWCTDMAVRVCSEAIQVFGGMGFVEETGIAQHYRDARILGIYEGTNGIQASDFIFRKIMKDGGEELARFLNEAQETLACITGDEAAIVKQAFEDASSVQEWILKNAENKDALGYASKPVLNMFALIAGAACLTPAWDKATEGRKNAARHFIAQHLSATSHLATKIKHSPAP